MSAGAAPRILERLKSVRRGGDGWIAPCPAHEDRNPSLSIHVRDGKTLLHCHAGCTTEAVCAALGIEVRELFADGGDKPSVVAEYDYRDEAGELLFQVVRFEPKEFRQRRPDGAGGWTWNLDGTRRVLYRLPEVLQASSVIVCEGEKDCEMARSLGLVATCNPGGAGKWRHEYSASLRGKRVTIIADNDEPGRKHAQQIAASLCGKVESLKVVELPGTSKDLSEWVAAGGTRDVLEGFIEELVPEWTPPTEQKPTVGKIRRMEDVPDIFALPRVPVTWAVSGFLPEGAVTTVAGEPGGCKSSFALSLAVAVATGGDFIGRRCRARDVLYLDRENPLAVMQQRLAMLGVESCPNLKIWGGWCPDPPPGIGDFRLLEIARERKPLIVFDSLIRFHTAEENSATEMAQVANELRALANAGATVLVLHHKGRDETKKYRGSSDIAGGPDVVYSASRDREASLLRLSCVKTRYVEEPEITLRLGSPGSLEFSVTDAPQVSQDKADSEVLRQVIEAEPALPKGKVIERSRLPEKRAGALLKRGEGTLWRSEKGERKARLFFPLPGEGEGQI